jgi:hypothetical protein
LKGIDLKKDWFNWRGGMREGEDHSFRLILGRLKRGGGFEVSKNIKN